MIPQQARSVPLGSIDPQIAAKACDGFAAFKRRYIKAKEAGQVELHVSMADVEALLALAQPTVNVLSERAREARR